MIDLHSLTIKKAHEHLSRKDFSVRELAQAYLGEIEKKNKDINAYLEIFDDVLTEADKAQEKISSGNILAGIPIALKDNILIKGKKASGGSNILKGYVAPYDATAVQKLKNAGAIFLGRTNMDEFAMGSSTENSAFGVTKNPYDTSRVAGGSSGGSAAAVAMDGALGALGSDTGGSVRQPASYCGIVGFKPTYGSISRHGLMAMGSSLDVIGPLTKTVEDAEILFNAMKGEDSYDSTSINLPASSGTDIKPLKIGIPRQFLSGEGVDAEVMKVFDETIHALEKDGHKIIDTNLPNIEYSLAVYYVIMPAEVSTNLARFDGVKYGFHKEGSNLIDDYFETRGTGFGRESRRRIMLGTYVLSSGYYDAYYNKATAVRELIKADLEKAFSKVDVIMTPTTPGVAFKIGEKVLDPVSMYLEDIFTVTANLAGTPAISIPCGTKKLGDISLPIGVQIMGRPNGDADVLTLGKNVEKLLPNKG